MSYTMNFSGHVEPADPKKDEVVRKAAAVFAATLDAAGIHGTGMVSTPSGGDGLASPAQPPLHVRPDGPGGSGTNH